MARETFFNLDYPFDAEVFTDAWSTVPDPTLTAMLESGAVVEDSLITTRMSGGSNLFTIPFYNVLSGDPVNHDGRTDIPTQETSGTSQSGIVFGRDKAWSFDDFAAELSGNDPVGNAAAQVGRYWNKFRQKTILRILDGVFNTTATDANATAFKTNHVYETHSSIGVTDLNELGTQALGDNKAMFGLAFMHSQVAKRLENLNVLEYLKYTDANAIQRPTRIATANGYTVIVDDSLPVSGTEYTTYLIGTGAIRHGRGVLKVPTAQVREELKDNGTDILVTRIRECYHPNGFSFIVPDTGWTESPTDAQLGAGACWKPIFDQKAIAMAKLVTDESVQ